MGIIKQKKLPLVSIVFICWNRKEEVENTLNEIKKTTYPHIEIITVDNGSTDGTKDMIGEKFPGVKLICLPENKGIYAYNVGFASASGEYIVILDDDSHPEKDAIKKMVKKFEEDLLIGAIAFKIEDGIEQRESWYHAFMNSEEIDAPVFVGCGAGIRTQLLKKIGYYSESFFLYENDLELAIKCVNEGFKIRYCPDIISYHRLSKKNRGGSNDGRVTNRNIYFGLKNDLLTIWKYFPFKTKTNLTANKILSVGFRSLTTGNFRYYLKAIKDAVRQWRRYSSEYQPQIINKRIIAEELEPFIRENSLKNNIVKLKTYLSEIQINGHKA